MIKIKNQKGFTFLELILSLFLLSIFLTPMFLSIHQTRENIKFSREQFEALEFTKNILEVSTNIINNKGINYILEKENIYINDLLLENGFIENEDYLKKIFIVDINKNSSPIIFTDSEKIINKEIGEIFSENSNLFLENKLKNYNIEIEEVENKFIITKGTEFTNILDKKIFINTKFSENIYIKFKDIKDLEFLEINNLENINVNIDFLNSNFETDFLEKIFINKGKIFLNKINEPKIGNYILIVSVFNKDYKKLYTLGRVV